MPTQLQQQPNVTYMHSVHQPPPVVPQQQQMVNAQTSYNYLAQPVPQYSHMVPPGMPTTTIPPLALHAPHPPPLQSLRIEQERVANLRAQEDRAAEEDRTHAAAGSSSQQQQGTVHWRVQICHKSLSVVYYIKKWFLLIYLLTAGRSESKPCY